ncbi:hypothetical protein BDW22DRAFT_1362816 [Trametopsis cervina]|nr:hypothetical protein BDW22DRAFT_1362816 [Trametopsis cervina]
MLTADVVTTACQRELGRRLLKQPSSLSMQVTISNTYGAGFLGGMLATFLYGITCVQTCIYNITFVEDMQPMEKMEKTKENLRTIRTMKARRTLVNILWVLDTFHLYCVVSTMYFFLIRCRGRLPGTDAIWSDGALIIAANLSDCLVKFIYIHCVHLLCGYRVLIIPLGTSTVVAAGFGIFYGVVTVSNPPSILANETASFSVYTALGASAATDIAISCMLCFYYHRQGQVVETAYPLLHKLSLYAIQAGVLPSSIALTSLITYAIYPRTFLYMGVFFVLQKATLNSMLAMLNARKSLRSVLPDAAHNMALSVDYATHFR